MGPYESPEPTRAMGETQPLGASRDCSTPAQLIVLGGQDAGLIRGVDGDEFVIGRHRSSDLVLRSNVVSRRHAVLHRGADGYTVEDVGSRNGVVINGRKLASRARQLLQHRDVLQLSDSQVLYLQCQDSAELSSLATIHLDHTKIAEDVSELIQRYLGS